jgi:SAM-dependent methyltransferase
MYKFDVELSPNQLEELARTDPKAWFTGVEFANARSPVHPEAKWLEENNSHKQAMVGSWISQVVPGRRVLDTFCANGVFSFLAAQEGAKSVTGVDFEGNRIDAANLVVRLLAETGHALNAEFRVADVYRLAETVGEKFDVVLCLGGLYHIPDPAYVLSQLHEVTGEWLIMQTARVLHMPGNWARFTSRPVKQADKGLSSIRAGTGVWHLSPECIRQLLHHSGFEIVAERRSPLPGRKRYPWFGALARPC